MKIRRIPVKDRTITPTLCANAQSDTVGPAEQSVQATPGPWRIAQDSHYYVNGVNVKGMAIFPVELATPPMTVKQTVAYATSEANARLIAAAPAMLEALKAVAGGFVTTAIRVKVEAAINLAEKGSE